MREERAFKIKIANHQDQCLHTQKEDLEGILMKEDLIDDAKESTKEEETAGAARIVEIKEVTEMIVKIQQ